MDDEAQPLHDLRVDYGRTEAMTLSRYLYGVTQRDYYDTGEEPARQIPEEERFSDDRRELLGLQRNLEDLYRQQSRERGRNRDFLVFQINNVQRRMRAVEERMRARDREAAENLRRRSAAERRPTHSGSTPGSALEYFFRDDRPRPVSRVEYSHLPQPDWAPPIWGAPDPEPETQITDHERRKREIMNTEGHRVHLTTRLGYKKTIRLPGVIGYTIVIPETLTETVSATAGRATTVRTPFRVIRKGVFTDLTTNAQTEEYWAVQE